METMRVRDTTTGAVVDVIGIDAGTVTSVTGVADPALTAIREAYTRRGMRPPANLGAALDGWTDGALTLESDPVTLPDGWEPPVPDAPISLAEAGSDAKLRQYWTSGKGAAKIRWGVGGDFYRCVRHLGKYVARPKGLCNEYHQLALGAPPGKGH